MLLCAVLVIGGIFFVGLVDSQSYTPYSKVGLSLYLLDSDGGENPGRRYQDHDRDYVSYKS